MRESDSETEREVWLRQRRKQVYRRSLSPAVRSHREGRGPGWVPPNGEDGDDWHVVSPRRRKAWRQAMRRQDWTRGEQQFRERLSAARRQSRPRLSRQVFDVSEVDYYQVRKADWYREELDGGRGNREGLDYERDSRKHAVGRRPLSDGSELLWVEGRRIMLLPEGEGPQMGTVRWRLCVGRKSRKQTTQLFRLVDGRQQVYGKATPKLVSLLLSILRIFRRFDRTFIYGKS